MNAKNESGNIYYILIIFIGIIGIFYYYTFGWLIQSWMHNEYYSHGFIVPIISGYIIWNMKSELAAMEKKPSQAGLALLMGGIAFHGISILWTIRSLSGLSLLLTIAGVIVYVYGLEFLKKIWFPFLFLILMIPLPVMGTIAPPLQFISAFASANVAYLIGIPVVRDGLVLNLPSGSFEVGLPCSGVNSIISLFTIGILFAFIIVGSKTMKMTVLASIIPLALAGNVIRITSVLAVANSFGKEVAIDYFHDFSSLLLFSIALAGLFLVGRCFGRLQFKKIF